MWAPSLTLALAAPVPLAAPGYSLFLVTVFTAPFLAPAPNAGLLGECDQVPQMGSLDVTAWKADVLGGSIGSLEVLAPPWWSKVLVWAVSGGQRRDAWHPQQGPGPPRVRRLQDVMDPVRRSGRSEVETVHASPPLALEERKTDLPYPRQVRAWDRSGPRRGQGSLETPEASWNPVRHQPGWAHRPRQGQTQRSRLGSGTTAGPAPTISGDWRPALGPRRRTGALGRW